MKKITILGVTGSIGTQTIDVLLHHKEFELVAMSAGRNIEKLEEIITQIPVKHICVIEKEDCIMLQNKYPHIQFYCGNDGLIQIATISEVDIVVNAIVGFAGMLATIEAIKSRKDIALANKETLVVAGHIIMDLVKQYNVKLLPVDSEHSAIFQSLNGENPKEIKKILLTASGGSFRDKSREELIGVTVKDALNHPNWSMGAKITIDSATMFNKGLEVMEAKWLFDVDYKQIEVVIHPESIIHSMVEYIDTSIIAQLGKPDMRLAIQYALSYPSRIVLHNSESLDVTTLAGLHFKKPDFKRFKALELSYRAGTIGGSMPCVLNAANEVANELFLKEKIEFLQIEEIVEDMMNNHRVIDNPSIEQLVEIDAITRQTVYQKIGE